MLRKGKALYLLAILLFLAAVLSFRPGIWLIHKPASSQNEHYVKGWEDGCISGTNSYSLLYAPLLDKPFIKDLEPAAKTIVTPEKPADKTATSGKDHYKSGWNEGFTLCRFYQSSVYELMQFAIIVATLLFIGYQLRKNR
jgi:ABC-type glycerol-3-phosphate transport system permease component